MDISDLRKKIERLRGDVEYWRAAAAIEEIVGELGEVGEQFDGAAARRPRLNSNASASIIISLVGNKSDLPQREIMTDVRLCLYGLSHR